MTVPSPVWPNLPTPAAFVPLVFLVTGIAAGVFAWSDIGLTEYKAAWGLRALQAIKLSDGAVLGFDATAPAYVWSLSAALSLPGSAFWKLPLPSFLFAIASLVLLYRIARRWYSAGTGLVACFLLGTNHAFLEAVRNSGPSTASLAAILFTIWCYLRHERTEERVSFWLAATCGSIALALLTAGSFTVWLLLVAALLYLFTELHRRRETFVVLRQAFQSSTFWIGVGVVALAVVFASPWLATGEDPEWAARFVGAPVGVGAIVAAMPAAICFAAWGFARAVKECLRGGAETSHSALLAIWTLVGCLAVAHSPPEFAVPFVLAPLHLLAARTFLSLLHRKLVDRHALYLAIAAGWVFILAQSPSPGDLIDWTRGEGALTAEQKLTLHYTVDLLILVAGAATAAYFFSAKHDRYRRRFVGMIAVVGLLGSSLPALTTLTEPAAVRDVWRRTYENLKPLDDRRRLILVGLEPPSVRLNFLVVAAFPRAEVYSAPGLSDINNVIQSPDDDWLILATNPVSQMPTSTSIEWNGEQMVFPQLFANDVVAVYATVTDETPPASQ